MLNTRLPSTRTLRMIAPTMTVTPAANMAFSTRPERHLIVIDDRRMRPVTVEQRVLLGAEIAQDVVGYAVGELIVVRAVGKQAAEGGDD